MKGTLNSCNALSEFCKSQRTTLSQYSDDEQEIFEELAFNYALCREMNSLSVKSGYSNLTAITPLREAISLLAQSLAGRAKPSGTAGKSPLYSAPSKNSKLTLVKSIMEARFRSFSFLQSLRIAVLFTLDSRAK